MLFHYQYSRWRSALTLAVNLLVLPTYYLFYLGGHHPQHEDVLQLILYALVAIELVLGAWLIWLLTHPATFEIRLSPDEFTIIHPTFSRWSFSVHPQDILRIEQDITGVDFRQEIRRLVLRDGQTFQICPNYRYSRKKLYAALKQANPAIELPRNPHHFRKIRQGNR